MDRVEVTRSDGSLRILRGTACAYSTYEETLPAPEGGEEIRCLVHVIRVASEQSWLHRAAASGSPVELRMTADDRAFEILDLLVTRADAGGFILEGREAL